MAFGFGAAVVAGFLLTAIPNWTGRMPLQGGPLALLVLLWLGGRIGVFFSARIGAESTAAIDLAFPAVFLFVVAREIITGQNWRNLPMLGALAFLLLGNLLTHFETIGIADTAGRKSAWRRHTAYAHQLDRRPHRPELYAELARQTAPWRFDARRRPTVSITSRSQRQQSLCRSGRLLQRPL